MIHPIMILASGFVIGAAFMSMFMDRYFERKVKRIRSDASRVRIDLVTVFNGVEATVIQGVTLENLATMAMYEGMMRFSLPKRSRLTLTVIEPDEQTKGDSE